MPGSRRRPDSALERALAALRVALDATRAPWMIIGGIAIIAHGVRRMTTDIDACVRGDAIGVEALLAALSRHGIEPRIPDAAAFARSNLVLLLRHRETGVDLDVSLAWTSFEHEALEARTETRFGSTRAPMATVEDLIVFKAVAGRARDRDDVAALLDLHGDIDVTRVKQRVTELAELAEAPEMLAMLELLPERPTRSPRPQPARSATKPRPARPKRRR